MKNIELNYKDALKYVSEILKSCCTVTENTGENNYHHNASYESGVSIINNGILSLNDLNNSKIISLSNEQLEKYDDILSHPNGKSGISLALMGLTDLYRDEVEYNAYSPTCLDFHINRSVKTIRTATNYGNEFITYEKITPSLIKELDIRLLTLIKKALTDKEIRETIIKFNYLKEIILAIKKSNLNIPIYEMSEKTSLLNVDELTNIPKIMIKK